MRPFRFGVQLSGAADGPGWRDKARKVEALGYSSLLMPDHFDNQWSPTVALTSAAEVTTTLKVGALVFSNDYRHPVVLAREIATLDRISGGRVEFGLGAGWLRSDYEAAGMPYDRPGVRIARMAEALEVMKQLWSVGYATFSGEHYQVHGARGLPHPVTRPHPPVLIGGGGRKLLSLAAREADIVGVNPSLPSGKLGPEVAASALAAAFAERIEWIREAAGDRMDSIELQCMTTVCRVVENRADTLDRIALPGAPAEAMGEMPVVLVGTVEEICETLERRREQYGFTYWVVHEPEMEAFAPVVARMAGR